jgi:hypothetical protein
MDAKLLATIIAVAKKEAGAQARDLSSLERKVEDKLKEFNKRSPILDLPSFAIKDGVLKCTWSSGLVLDFGNVVGPQGPQGAQGPQGIQGVAGKDGTSGKDGINGKDGRDGKDGVAAAAGRDGVDGKQGLTGAVGPRGEPGQDGKQGVPGNDGKDAERGAQGLPGLDGADGEDGVGVEKAWVGDNHHLTIKLTSGKIIDAGYVRGPAALSGKGGRITGGSSGGGIGESFETTSKNLGTHPFVLSRTGDVLDSITYTTPTGDTVKSFTYSNGVLVSITLSGVFPVGMKTVKTLLYSAGVLTGVTYS